MINQIRAFLLERGIAVRRGRQCLRAELPTILATRSDVLSARMIEDLALDWRGLDERIDGVSEEIERLARADVGAQRLMNVPGKVTPSTPGAPSLSFASAYAARSVSNSQTWTYKPRNARTSRPSS